MFNPFFPYPFKFLPVGILFNPLSFTNILRPHSLVWRLVRQLKLSLPMFHSVFVEPSILRPVRPNFLSEAILLIIFPISLVMGAVYLSQLTLSMNFVVRPLANVDEAILWIDKITTGFCFSIFKTSLVLTAVGPYLFAFTVQNVGTLQKVTCAERIVTFKFYIFAILVITVLFEVEFILIHFKFLDLTFACHFWNELIHKFTFISDN